MKVAIVGAGFYGTYIGYKLSKINNLKVDLFEKNKNICLEVAQNNKISVFGFPPGQVS